ncbi:hypothetical protein C8F04DRAFT_1239479 [Mycena alexandri]|uniref:F-box domain-containing protein n=1 Tax=Mycena alexandri TaxID=1745969 RepID=A0AAD6SBN2_9AGAR|nr:hypothetical protein C8F04DRAFT_1239479 [Mycena alexandri]
MAVPDCTAGYLRIESTPTILTLPNEIVSEIFVHFLPVYPECPPPAGILSPFNLTRICRKWRLATPDLWRAVALPLHSEISFARQARETDDWLSRSRSCPLSIEIVETGDYATNLDDWVFPILAALNPRRARWEHLNIHIQERPHLLTFEDSMPLLRHLQLFSEDFDSDRETIVFGEAPLLRSVILNGFAARKVILPLAQLTSLDLFRVHPETCLPILQQTPNLMHFHLYLISRRGAACPADVTLRRLESLGLFAYVDEDVAPPSGYLQTFIVPALRELHIPEQFLTRPINSLTSFISQSGCELREVHLIGKLKVAAETYRSTFPLISKFSFHCALEDGRQGPEVEQDYYSSDDFWPFNHSSESS